MGQQSDITAEAAGAVILDSPLEKVDEFLHISRRLRSIALQSAVGGPVQACPPSAWYHFRKLARRNQRVAVLAGLVFALLVSGLAMFAVSYTRVQGHCRKLG